MLILKKLVFAIPFLLFLTAAVLNIPQFLNDSYLVLSFDFNDLLRITTLVAFIVLTSLMFVIFACLANDWRLVLPVALISALPIIFIIQGIPSYILSIGVIISLGLIYTLLCFKLKSYLSFSASTLLSSPIKNLTLLIIVLVSVAYFFTATAIIGSNFEIPDGLLNTAISFVPQSQDLNQEAPVLPSIDPSQIALLKANPELLKQYNIDPKMLDTLTPRENSSKNINPINELVKAQLQETIKPYSQFIAPALTLLFFLSLISISSLFNILIPPILWLIFYLLEASGYIKFEKEMREVKKLVV